MTERVSRRAAALWVRVLYVAAALLPAHVARAQAQPQPPATNTPGPSSAPPAPSQTPEASPTPSEPPPTIPYDEAAVRRRLGNAFGRGSVRLTLLLGTGSTVTDTYFILGGGLGYFVLDGLEVGLDYEAWLFGTPVMQRLSPEIRYVFHMVPVVKPYVGFFYRHTFIKKYDDFDYLGGRVGVYVAPEQSRLYFGGGAVYEHMLSCTSDAFIDCDQWYPEVTIGVMF